MKLVIFDCDGTLVDSQHVIVTAMNQAFTANGLAPLPRTEILSIVGLSLPMALTRLLPEMSTAAVHAVSESYRAAFFELRQDVTHHEPMYPGALAAITALGARDDIVLGVATGKSIRGLNAILNRLEIRHHFSTLQTADTHPSKPHPSMIFKAMAEVGAAPADTVMIGDTTFDIEMALAAEVRAIGVAWGYHPVVALERAGAHVIVQQFEDVASAIDASANPSGASP